MLTYLSGIILYFKEVYYQTFRFVCLTPFLKQISHAISPAITTSDTIITWPLPAYCTLFTIILVQKIIPLLIRIQHSLYITLINIYFRTNIIPLRCKYTSILSPDNDTIIRPSPKHLMKSVVFIYKPIISIWLVMSENNG